MLTLLGVALATNLGKADGLAAAARSQWIRAAPVGHIQFGHPFGGCAEPMDRGGAGVGIVTARRRTISDAPAMRVEIGRVCGGSRSAVRHGAQLWLRPVGRAAIRGAGLGGEV